MTKNTLDHIGDICKKLCAFNFEDGIQFDPETVITSVIKPITDYQGIQVKFKGVVDRSKVHMRIDIGFADVVYPNPVSFVFPTILPLPAPNLLGYTYESVIAEKVDAMIQLGEPNSRMKDFYDVWFLANHVSFELNELVEALKATFGRRKTTLPEQPILFRSAFIGSSLKQEQWSNFCTLSDLKIGLNFSEVILHLTQFLKPIFESIHTEKLESLHWEPHQWVWK